MFRIFLVFGMLLSSCYGSVAAEPAYTILAADKGRVAIVDAQRAVVWDFATTAEVHDLWQLENGNILLPLSRTVIAEVNPAKEVVWKYQSQPKTGYAGAVEVHAFQPLPDGRVMIAESGNARIIEVDRAGQVGKEIRLTIDNPHPHRDTRMARKLANGHYLVCHEGDGVVREYDQEGKVVWLYRLDLADRPRTPGHGPEGHGTEVYGAIRLPNGNTLIGGGNNNRVLEVNADGKIVWKIDQDELPGIRLAWVTTIHRLPNGNTIVGNCHAGPENPQLFEVTPEKLVVWKFLDFQTFGNGLAASQILNVGGWR